MLARVGKNGDSDYIHNKYIHKLFISLQADAVNEQRLEMVKQHRSSTVQIKHMLIQFIVAVGESKILGETASCGEVRV